MKKSYSALNILQERLSATTDGKGFFRYLMSTRRYITIAVDYFEYVRGVIFVNDLRKNFGEEIPFQFDIAVLIHMLYKDFLSGVRKGSAPNEEIARYLIRGKQQYFKSKIEKRVMKPLTKNLFQFETVEEEEEATPQKDKQTAFLEIKMHENEILRAEVLLNDLEIHFKGLEISVEEVMAIVYLDFISNIKVNGNSLKLQKNIVAHLKQA
ncbi:hypothetical protein [Bacillus massilinigeriensis]|uniref:hypothetical protein n=1 Tax=Bacillus mediterraneensis TaxID=1805474 RepID=UPI0008F8F8A8|nr:hypothetical protein [Bacillus mediterraneensis]